MLVLMLFKIESWAVGVWCFERALKQNVSDSDSEASRVDSKRQ